MSPIGVVIACKKIIKERRYLWAGLLSIIHKSAEIIIMRYAEIIRYKEEWTPKISVEEIAKINGLRVIKAE